MREGIEHYVEREEARERLKEDALAAWVGFEPPAGTSPPPRLMDGSSVSKQARTRSRPCRTIIHAAINLDAACLAGHGSASRFPCAEKSGCRAAAVRALRQGAQTLGAHPGIGHPIEDMPPEFRDWFIPFGQSGYVVRYHFDGNLVAILAVRRGKAAGY